MSHRYRKVYESVDMYSPNQLKAKGISYKILHSSDTKFRALISYREYKYYLKVFPLFRENIPSINFGTIKQEGESLDMKTLLNVPHTPLILAAIMGLLRFWVDMFNIQKMEYGADGRVRKGLYDLYLSKHFSDFERTTEVVKGKEVNILTRKVNEMKLLNIYADILKEEQIEGGLSAGMSIADIARKYNYPFSKMVQQLKRGIQVEKEHTENLKIAMEIAKDHLAEDPEYYIKLKKIEK